MSWRVTCPNSSCGKSYNVPETAVGRRLRCKSCGTRIDFAETMPTSDNSALARKDVNSAGENDSGDALSWEGRNSIPSQLGRFEIQEELGSGGFGTVYRAFDPQLQRPVALKILRTTGDETHDRQRIKRFLVEGRAVARLQHPHIVAVFDAGQDQKSGKYYLAAAFIAGTTLSRAIDGQQMELRRAAKIVAQLAGALDYAHGQKILHRDVKPPNVMIDENGIPYLMDFGLARIEESESLLTRDGAVLGTAAYMSPEQAAGRQEEIGSAADQYSLGCLFYELLSGDRLFSGPVSLQIFHQINTPAPAPSAKNPAVPPDLDLICLKTLSKEPEGRYANCAELAADLERWLADEPIKARQLSNWERWNRWRRRNPVIAGLSISTAALLILVALISVVFVIRVNRLADAERQAKDLALMAEKKAEDKADEAQQKTREVEQASRKLEREVYKQRIARAHQLWLNNEMEKTQELLRQCPEKLRGWEWRFCQRLLDQGLLTIDVPNKSPSHSVTFSPDGKSVAAVGPGYVRMWDASSGLEKFLVRFPFKKRWRQRSAFIVFTPDGKQLAAACEDTVVRIWDVASGKELWNVDVPGEYVTSLAMSPDSQNLAIGVAGLPNAPLVPVVYNLETKQKVLSLPSLNGAAWVTGIAFSSSGKQIAAADTLGKIIVCNARTGALESTLQGNAPGMCLAFHPHERILAIGQEDNTVRIWDVAAGKLVTTLMGHSKVIMSLAFSPDGKLLASASFDTSIKIWDAVTFEELRTLRGHRKTPYSVQFAADSRRLVSAGVDGTIRIWDALADQQYQKFNDRGKDGYNYCIRFSPDGRQLATVGYTLKVFDIFEGLPAPRLTPFKPDLTWTTPKCADFSPDGSLIAVGGKGYLKVYSLADARKTQSFPVEGEVRFLSISPGGDRLAWVFKNQVRITNLKTGQPVRTYDQHQAPLVCAVFSPGGGEIASVSEEGMVRYWDVETGKDHFARRGPSVDNKLLEDSWPGKTVAFGPDEKFAVAGMEPQSQTAIVELWDLKTGKTNISMKASGKCVTVIDFSPDGRRLVSGSDDGTISFWDPDVGDETFTLKEDGDIYSIDFSPDGFRLATGGFDLFGRLWDATPSKPQLTGSLASKSPVPSSPARGADKALTPPG